MREFDTGAVRDNDTDKPDIRGFTSPYATIRFAEYMMKHQKQADGSLRASDNWKKGIPRTEYEKSLVRHMEEFKMLIEQGDLAAADEVLQAIFFNVQGWSHEYHKPGGPDPIELRDSKIIHRVADTKQPQLTPSWTLPGSIEVRDGVHGIVVKESTLRPTRTHRKDGYPYPDAGPHEYYP